MSILLKIQANKAINSADQLVMLDALRVTATHAEHYHRLARGWPEKRPGR